MIAINYTGTPKRTEFSYDPLGRRSRIVEKDDGTITSDKRFVWSGLEICEERDSSNVVTRRFYSQGEQIGGTAYFYGRDHLGSVRELTDNSGAIKARYDYDLWGNRSSNQFSGTEAIESEVGFTGHYFHTQSTLHLAPFRAYDARIGRWISRDPIGEDGGIDLYRYVLNRPVLLIDPLGLCAGFGSPGAGDLTDEQRAELFGITPEEFATQRVADQKMLKEFNDVMVDVMTAPLTGPGAKFTPWELQPSLNAGIKFIADLLKGKSWKDAAKDVAVDQVKDKAKDVIKNAAENARDAMTKKCP